MDFPRTFSFYVGHIIMAILLVPNDQSSNYNL